MMGMAIGAGVGVAAALGYQSMAPTGQWFGRAFCGLRPGSKQLALTYDDGPNDPYTLRLLEVLARHDVQATFFLIGRYVQQRGDIVRELAKAGHVIGNHTFTHPLLTFKSTAQISEETDSCRRAISDTVGEHTNLFRPPFGGRRPAVMQTVRSLGLEPVMWNITGYDWNAPSVEYIEHKVTRRLRRGNVILLHDGGHLQMGADRSRTVTATDRMIARYKAEGYEFVTIPEMMGPAAVSSQPSAIR
jgi:peptidoglycan-N-acetylglucosamine deacetylase